MKFLTKYVMSDKLLNKLHRRRSQIFVGGAERYKSTAHLQTLLDETYCNHGSIAYYCRPGNFHEFHENL